MNIQTSSDIQIYIACLASYNIGILHGDWIDATLTEAEIWDAIQDILASSPVPDAEEYAIHDYEGFYRIRIEEYSSIETVSVIAQFISEHGELGAELISNFGDVDGAKTAMDDDYVGQYDNLEDFARNITEDTTDIPENLVHYIDYERMARDLEINDVVAIELGYDTIHVFWQH